MQITPLAQVPASASSSKFGGQPWWPRALPYPQSFAGAPLSLLAQFNLAELPPLPLWPRQGQPLAGEYALRLAATLDLPAPSDYRFEAIAREMDSIDDAVIDKLFDAGLGTGSKLGGYAYFTQEDPRPYAKTQLQSSQPWQLLFQMDTYDEEDGVWIMWGDCGVGNFFIEPERLVVGDFSRVWYNWDCCE